MNHSNSRRSDHHHHYNHPSFSSSLLEQIYNSFDDNDDDHHHHPPPPPPSYSHTTTNRYINKSSTTTTIKNSYFYDRTKHDDHILPLTRFDLDEWMHQNNLNNTKSKNRRSSMDVGTATPTTASSTNNNNNSHFSAKLNYSSSSTSSSDSSSGICGFSSSDAESLCGSTKSKNLKPIKTTVINPPEFHRKSYSDELPAKNSKTKEGNLQKRALKLYGDLKKVKQPISPGGKLASFLNSLFNSSNSSSSSKKAKISSSTSSKTASSNGVNVKYSSTSTPSTASSYSRSCLSKTPSSAGRFERRSVRFCPVSTVMAYSDEREDKVSRDEVLKAQIMEKQRRVEEVAKELLKNYHHGRKFQNDVNNHSRVKNNSNSNSNSNIRNFEDEDEDEDDDDISCCSSDLFELDHLLEVGGDQRYCEELPVYETTHLDTNRAIAKGFIL